MTLRFRKSIKLAPGLRFNFSGSGTSWSFGPRGASVSVGKRGTYFNAGLPGTGLSTRQKLSGPSAAPRQVRQAPAREMVTLSVECTVLDDGTLQFTDSAGNPLPDHLINAAKKQQRDAIAEAIRQKCEEINEQVEALGRLHHDTPDPSVRPTFDAPAFPVAKPEPVQPKKLGLVARLFPPARRKIEAANAAAAARYRVELAEWESGRAAHQAAVADRYQLVAERIYRDVPAMEEFLEIRLSEIYWPRETLVAFEVMDDGKRVKIDVDLPEIEDMPTKLAAVPIRGLKLSVKELSATRVQRLYAEHVHGIVFRLLGEAFAALPLVESVSVSGYSQRVNEATGRERDEYLLSVQCSRPQWVEIDFSLLQSIDVVEALARLDLRREMTKTGRFSAITPHS
jgi:hypothetical protein